MKKLIYSVTLALCSAAAALASHSSKTLQVTCGPFNTVTPECTSIKIDCNPFENEQAVCTIETVPQYLFDDESEKCVIPLYKTEHW